MNFSNRIQSARLLTGSIAIVLSWVTTGIRAAEPSPANTSEQTIADELRLGQDATIFENSLWVDTEWDNFMDGSDLLEWTLGGLWAWRVSAHQDWAVRLKLPLDWHIAGDTPGDSDVAGLGDIKLATGTAFRLSETLRVGCGVEMRFPSATDDRLGDNQWRPQLIGALGWDITKSLSFSPSAEYNISIAEEDGVAPSNYLEMYFPINYLLPHNWLVTARYEAKLDFENDNEWTNAAKVVVSKRFEGPFGVTLSLKKPFDNGNKEFQVNLVVSYFFSSAKSAAPKSK